MTIYDAPPGAGEADCDVCGHWTYLRLVHGDGHVPLCSDECERAWPRMTALKTRVAQLEAVGMRNAQALHDIATGKAPDGVTRALQALGTHSTASVGEAKPLTGAELAEKHGFEPIPDWKKDPFVRPMLPVEPGHNEPDDHGPEDLPPVVPRSSEALPGLECCESYMGGGWHTADCLAKPPTRGDEPGGTGASEGQKPNNSAVQTAATSEAPKNYALTCGSCGVLSPIVPNEDEVADAAVDAGWLAEGHNEDDRDACPSCRTLPRPDNPQEECPLIHCGHDMTEQWNAAIEASAKAIEAWANKTRVEVGDVYVQSSLARSTGLMLAAKLREMVKS